MAQETQPNPYQARAVNRWFGTAHAVQPTLLRRAGTAFPFIASHKVEAMFHITPKSL